MNADCQDGKHCQHGIKDMIKSADFFSKLSVENTRASLQPSKGFGQFNLQHHLQAAVLQLPKGWRCFGNFCSVDTQVGVLCLHFFPSEMENVAAVDFMQSRVQQKGGTCSPLMEETKFKPGHIQDFLSDISKCQAVHETKLWSRAAILWPCRNISDWCKASLHLPIDLWTGVVYI